MKILTLILRVLLGLMFVVFGSNAFLHFIPMPPMSGPSGDFIMAMAKTGYLYAIGACQVIRRSVFDEVGGLDGSIFYGPEDVDFCLRVKAAGHRVVQVAGADVLHPPRRAFRQPFTARGMRHGWAIVRHLWRHRGSSSPPS